MINLVMEEQAMDARQIPAQRRTAVAPPTAEAIAALRLHPRFPEAFGAAIGDLVAVYRRNRIVNQVLSDRGRVVFGILAMYLHFSPDTGGLTASGMKALCTETELCSPGRATALLSLMRFAGYVTSAPHALDRRVRLLIPTERLIEDHKQRLRGELLALALLMPEGEIGLSRLGDADFIAEMACCFGEAYRFGFRMLDHAPELYPLAERHTGLIILMSLLLEREPGDTLPPRRSLPISISAISKRFGVSRPHVLKLLRDAAALGMIRFDTEEAQRIEVLPPLADGLQNFVAAVMVLIVHCVRTALARVGQRQPGGGRCSA